MASMEQDGSTGAAAPSESMLPTLAVAGAAAALAILAALHFASPEYDPAWRMVSEYALGKHGWLLAAFFLCWAVSSWALAAALVPLARTGLAKAGLGFLTLSGLGQALAAFFDVGWPVMHGVAAMIGVPSVPIAALLIGYGVDRGGAGAPGRGTMRLTAHLSWIAFLAMAAAMVVFMSTYQSAGGDMSAGPPASLPDGTVAVNGWTNRLLVAAYCAWLIACARWVRNLRT